MINKQYNKKIKRLLDTDFWNIWNFLSVVSVLHKALCDFVNDHGFLPRILLLNFDNCARENKNMYVFSYCYMLVELGIVEEVLISFLLVGHTGSCTQWNVIFSIFKVKMFIWIYDPTILRTLYYKKLKIQDFNSTPAKISRNL